MESLPDDEKKFDADNAGRNDDDDQMPDPDEPLMLDQGNGRVWMVKIPKNVMERWSALDAEDVHLATIRVYNDNSGAVPPKKPKIFLFLPPSKQSPTPDPSLPTFKAPPAHLAEAAQTPVGEPEVYELTMLNDDVTNQIVVAERPKNDPASNASGSLSSMSAPPAVNSRARTTILTGRIKHECNLRPLFNASYRRQMKLRSLKANTPKRQTKMIEDTGLGKGGINRLTSGVGVGAENAFKGLVKTKPKAAKGTFERMARIPRNQLYDLLFQLFREKQRWSLKDLRERTQQPEAYLKEVLNEVAYQHRSGEFNTLWEAKLEYKDQSGSGAKTELGDLISMSPLASERLKMEDDNYDDDDDDDDMEEIS
ncbi:transcription initiation factor IIF, beta subunit-domain-containing protein [Pterulicium gracile]|uniref:Transcription initiation factor IIF subunit beta n=1 Tax=Pterulicium gracile TaxID=1884261 RepID=A0A5C3QKQ6_9AGAR|nr:transcription initiation factor IIF, beta subunit-domain-containing protein [Pterula gracilis]